MGTATTSARLEPLAVPASSPGHAAIHVVRDGPRSVVVQAYATSPLRLLTPRNHGHAAWVYTSSLGGGLVDGDHLALDLRIGDGATAFVSTQASTKVYRSPSGTRAELSAHVADEGLLVMAPDPVVCFAGARYRQVQQIDLAGRAGLVLLDWVSSGRRESGERWDFREYVAQLVVRMDGTLVVQDALALCDDDGDLAERLGRFDVLAVAVIAGHALRGQASAVASTFDHERIVVRPDQLIAVAPLAPARIGHVGCLIRIAGRSVEGVGRAARECLGFVPGLLGDDPWARKW